MIDSLSAYERIKKYIRKTPVIEYENFLFKLENLQKSGSFKPRGAYNKILKNLNSANGVVCASSGNHAQAVAKVCSDLNIKNVKIVVPNNTPLIKINKIKNYGYEPIFYGNHLNESLNYAREIAKMENFLFVHPYDDEDIIEGQGTIAVEISNYEFEYLFIPIGGGGLASGISLYIKKVKPNTKIFGVVSENAPSFYYSFKQNKIVEIEPKYTLADGIRLKYPSKLTFSILKELLEDVILVSEDEIKYSIKWAYYYLNQIVEGAGAITLAVFLFNKVKIEGKAMFIISGGNIDESILDNIL
ncbi:MAG: threonine/serine dehydratase [candidate division WOR-3 bacterium]|nr:threonine/serine dehydratase [candidate division WOR-3 bacterium]MCX7947487.1 threonine/serine dehydratase [candidate division WOR-3 bacterium]MDW8150646.1 threonine/serine dehydratase [candidate division WOR-3 bacterium]